MKLLLTGYIPSHFCKSDAGRSQSKRPKQKNDCAVRSLSLVASVSYDTAYDYIAYLGRKCSNGDHHLQKG
ncbi:hypothetical protein LCGC14_0895700 [marine sediment metagenome]|uniref:Uncharacterized protein n=1 Tax=marine sediment metagenome TaxID=412755 RepID=A0A0F9S4U7_9ZZZZ